MDFYEEINSIDLNEYEIRDNLDDRSIDGNIENSADFLSLLKDIESNGILVPLIFARKGEKELELISGRRRLEAVRALNNALRSEDKPTIQIIPAKIIKEDVPDSIIYQIAYSENSLRKDLSQSAKVEAMFLPLFNACNSDFAKAKSKQELSKRNFAMEGFLEELKALVKKISSNRRNITPRENFIIEELKKLASIFNNMPYLRMLNSITKYKLTVVEKRLITHYGLELKHLLLCKKTRHNNSLKKIKEAYMFRAIQTPEEYESLKSTINDFNAKLSDFYKIDNIDNFYIANFAKKAGIELLTEWSDNLMLFLCEKLKEIMQNYKGEKKREPKNVLSREINALIKSMPIEKLEQIKDFIEKSFIEVEEGDDV